MTSVTWQCHLIYSLNSCWRLLSISLWIWDSGSQHLDRWRRHCQSSNLTFLTPLLRHFWTTFNSLFHDAVQGLIGRNPSKIIYLQRSLLERLLTTCGLVESQVKGFVRFRDPLLKSYINSQANLGWELRADIAKEVVVTKGCLGRFWLRHPGQVKFEYLKRGRDKVYRSDIIGPRSWDRRRLSPGQNL